MFGMSMADFIRLVLMIVFCIVCFVATVLVLMQESKQTGLSGAISGAGESYWGKIKGRSLEGKLVKWSTVLVIVFFVLGLVLDMNF